MTAALTIRGCDVVLHTYPREMHAFHAFIFRKRAQQCWGEMLDFLDERLQPC